LFHAVWVSATIAEFPTILHTQTILVFMWRATMTGQKAAADVAIEKKFTSLGNEP
jgi:hypothetical protein